MTERNVCITAVDGQTGFAIAELLLTNEDFANEVTSVVGLTLHPSSAKAKELAKMGVKIVPHKPGKAREMVKSLKDTKCDTLCLIPPTHKEKFDITLELIQASKKANIPNVCFLSSAGCDLADPEKQPRLREFTELECLVMAAKGDNSTSLGNSPVVIRSVDRQYLQELKLIGTDSAGFYAENLLLYAPQAQKEGVLPLPIGTTHMFPPVALGVSNAVSKTKPSAKKDIGCRSACRASSFWERTERVL